MPTPSMKRPLARRLIGGLCAAALVTQMGCYSYLPLQTNVPATGKRVAVQLNDRGRFTLADRLGAAVDLVDGLLVAVDSSSVTLEVYRTNDLRGGSASWTGERVQIDRANFVGFRERQLSKTKTTAFVAAAVGIVAATFLLTNLNILGPNPHADPGSGPGEPSR